MRPGSLCRGGCVCSAGFSCWAVAACLPLEFPIWGARWIGLMGSWGFFLGPCTWLTGYICISPSSAGMKRESTSLFTARSRYTRERAAGDYVDAGRRARVVVYRTARRPSNDRRESYHPYTHLAGGGVCFSDEIFSKQSAAHHLFANTRRKEGVHELHQFAGGH